jgi:hypothetical protein
MAASAKRRNGSGPRRARVRLLPPLLVPLSAAEERALVEALAVALQPLLVGGESAAPGSARADEIERGERGAGSDL